MSIYFVIHTQSSRSQNSPRGAESQPTTFFLSSCSHIFTKAREEVSHQASVPLTRVCSGGWGRRCLHKATDTQTGKHTNTHNALVASHKYPTRCNFPPRASRLSPPLSSTIQSGRCPRSCPSASLSKAAGLTTRSVPRPHFIQSVHTGSQLYPRSPL